MFPAPLPGMKGVTKMFSDVRHGDVFGYFSEISAIPRPSGKEEKIADYLVRFANERGLEVYRDKANNVIIRKHGAADAPSVMLQGHTDMVCEALPGIEHDFLRDPIKFVRNGDVLSADGTTLGADDGVSGAVMLAILDSDTLRHPDLECLFTSGEEVGMIGMNALDMGCIRSRRMINIDSSGEGVATVACAGGVRSDFSFTTSAEPTRGTERAYDLVISGLYGGHSGEDIALGRTNAIVACTGILRAVAEKAELRIVSVRGGDKDNAIPRDCTVRFIVSDELPQDTFDSAVGLIRHALIKDDANFDAALIEAELPKTAASVEDTRRILDFLAQIPSGPLAMSPDVPGMVETSENLAVIRWGDGHASVTVSSRSSVEEALDAVLSRLTSLARLAGCKVNHRDRYPGWDFDPSSQVLEVYKSAYTDLFGKVPEAIGIHAGLECGLVKSVIPDMDVISIGPEITDLHSPSERLSVQSLDRLYDIVTAMLERLA